MEQVYACVTDQGVDFNRFLVAITDESILDSTNDTTRSSDIFSSTEDLNNTEAFRQRVCR